MKKSLNLSNNFSPTEYESLEFEYFKFNGGEQHIKIKPFSCEKVIITNRIMNSDDIIKILIAKDALKRYGIKSIELIIPYLPYARQDRQCVIGESLH